MARIPTFSCLALAVLLPGCGNDKVGKPAPGDAAPAARTGTDTSAAPAPASGITPTSLPGSDSAPGLQALVDTVRVRALRGDTLGLIRLLVDDTLFRRHVYPLSPAYDSSRESVYQFVRGMDKANNAKGLRRMLHDVQALGADSVPVAFAFDTVPAPGASLYRLRPARGVRLFGGALRTGGAYRVLNYSESGAAAPSASEPPSD